MSILEDCQDTSLASKDELVNTCVLLQSFGQDEENFEASEDFDLLAKTVYWQLVERAYELDSDEVLTVSAIFQRLFTLRILEEPLARLSDEIRAQAKRVVNDE